MSCRDLGGSENTPARPTEACVLQDGPAVSLPSSAGKSWGTSGAGLGVASTSRVPEEDRAGVLWPVPKRSANSRPQKCSQHLDHNHHH